MFGCCQEPNTPGHRVMKLFAKVTRMQRSVIASRVKQTGVYRSQHQILMYIALNPDASQKDIARMHEVSTATIAVSLKKLEKGGYIRRVVDTLDNRCNRLQVTEKGQQVVDQSHEIFLNTEKEIFGGFTEDDFQALERLLARVYRNMEQMNGGSCKETDTDEKQLEEKERNLT
ncbi:MAG: MarR family winged helix-turn-helix transcriptional regulator [Lachnospiraceae bacterium]|nr:MarR family winged helix-turn-helix transcriptional regulator [Lachnospiraceae bacterium]